MTMFVMTIFWQNKSYVELVIILQRFNVISLFKIGLVSFISKDHMHIFVTKTAPKCLIEYRGCLHLIILRKLKGIVETSWHMKVIRNICHFSN